MALGADKNRLLALILLQGLKLVLVGLLAGLGAAAAGAHLIGSLLSEINPLDPLVYGGVTVLFMVIACLVPSLRASRVDPLVALRTD